MQVEKKMLEKYEQAISVVDTGVQAKTKSVLQKK